MGGAARSTTLVLAAVIGGCVSVPVTVVPGAGRLADSEWTLIDVRQSSSAEPVEVTLNKYRLSLAAAGTAALALDCNRGTGTWSATGERNGTIRFGPIAATQALCADNGLGERLGRDLSGASPYAINDGRLTIRTAAATYTFDTID